MIAACVYVVCNVRFVCNTSERCEYMNMISLLLALTSIQLARNISLLYLQLQKPLHASLSYSSSCVSASEFFDAEEYQLHQDAQGGRDGSDTSSEAGSLTSEEGSVSSENSEAGTEYTPAQSSKY